MVSTFIPTFTAIFKKDITENDFSNALKLFVLNYSSYLFESEPQVSFQIDNGNIIPVNINNTKISVKSLIPKDEDGPVDIIARKEYLLAYPDTEYVNCITNGSFVGQYRIERNEPSLIKITTNKASGKTKEKMVYPSTGPDGYKYYSLRSDDWPSNKKSVNVYAQRLFGMVFNDNDDIINNTECDHIDRNRCNNRSINLRWVTSTENMNNIGVCTDKIDRKHDRFDIVYLEKCIAHEKVKYLNIKNKLTKTKEAENKKQKKIKWMEDYIESINSSVQLIKNEINN
jgi:hypothetical protein